MGIIDYYAKLTPKVTVTDPIVIEGHKKHTDEINTSKVKVSTLPDAIDVTLAEYNPATRDQIVAHKIKDYRRRRFNLRLLPKVTILFDYILEGSDYWNERVHDESPYT